MRGRGSGWESIWNTRTHRIPRRSRRTGACCSRTRSLTLGAKIGAPTVREGLLVAPQVTGIHSKSDNELGIGLIAPQADVLDGKSEGEGVRHLVFHAFEERDLAAVAGGFFVEPVHVRRQVAKRTVRSEAEPIPGDDVEGTG